MRADSIASIERFSANELVLRFDARSNWTHMLQYRYDLPMNSDSGWTNLYIAPPQSADGQREAFDVVVNPRRFYRLKLSPP